MTALVYCEAPMYFTFEKNKPTVEGACLKTTFGIKLDMVTGQVYTVRHNNKKYFLCMLSHEVKRWASFEDLKTIIVKYTRRLAAEEEDEQHWH